MRKIMYLICFFFVASCAINVDQDIKNIERILDVKLEDGYEIMNQKYEYGIGDSIKSFDIVFTKTAFDPFFDKVKGKFEKLNNENASDIETKNEYFKNIDLGGTRIHLSISLTQKKLHYSIVDL